MIKKTSAALLAASALFLTSCASQPAPEVPPMPAPTQTVEVPKTPEDCERYIALSKEVFDSAGIIIGVQDEALSIASKVLSNPASATQQDATTLENGTSTIEAETRRLHDLRYDLEKAEKACLGTSAVPGDSA